MMFLALPAILAIGIGLITMLAFAPLSDTNPGPKHFAGMFALGRGFVMFGVALALVAFVSVVTPWN